MTLPAPIVATADAAPRTLAGVLQHALSSHDRVALTQADRPGEDVTYPALLSAAREVAAGLAALGVEAGDRVGIFASTRADWTVADVGALLCGAIVVPIYHTSAPEEVQYIVEHSGARVVLCEEGAPRTTLDAVADSCPALEHRIVLGESAAEDGLAGLRARGREVGDGIVAGRLDGLRPDDIATIVYTSGTTGRPKGCMLTHANVLAAVDMYCDRLGLRERAMSVFFFLPLAHVLARVTQYVVLSTGGTLHFWSGDPARLAQELRAAGPTHFPAVPRIYEKIHAVVHAGAEEHGRVRRALFGWALEQGRRTAAVRRGERSEPPARVVRGVADRLVLSRVRAAFGGKLDVALTGAAPIAADILEFFDACGVVVLEGYGLTESCAAATLNTRGERRLGTVGRALPGSQVRVAEDGELLIEGPQVFAGYFRDEQATAAALSDGWLRTGDIGSVDADGYVRVTGRQKDLIITSSGKNIAPSTIEELLRESRWVAEAIVAGDGRPYLVALLALDPEQAPALAAHVGADAGSELAGDARVHRELQGLVDAVNARVARVSQIKRFAILDGELTVAGGELTPTMKVKRALVLERHAQLVEGLYEPGGPGARG